MGEAEEVVEVGSTRCQSAGTAPPRAARRRTGPDRSRVHPNVSIRIFLRRGAAGDVGEGSEAANDVLDFDPQEETSGSDEETSSDNEDSDDTASDDDSSAAAAAAAAAAFVSQWS